MNEAKSGVPGDKQDETTEALFILNYYMRKVEEERGDPKRTITMGNPLLATRSTKYLTPKQYSFIKDFLTKYISAKRIIELDTTVRSEVHLYLGFAYERGLFGMEREHRMAFSHYMSSAELNNAFGTFKVAQCYEKGMGKQKNINRSLWFYRCAAKLGLIDAMHTYGNIILFGDMECENDLEVGHFYLKLAAKKASNEYPYPLYDLGRCYEGGVGSDVIPTDDHYAFKLYSRGAALDCPNCQFRIGRCFENGELGQEKDNIRAIEWYMKAADLGQSDAQLVLSTMFLSGIKDVLKKNDEMAFRFGLRAATREHTIAAYLVSEYYEQGIGVKKNLQLAFWWSKIAEEFQKIYREAGERIKVATPDSSINDSQHDFEDNLCTDPIKA